jgi:hypothetical protein
MAGYGAAAQLAAQVAQENARSRSFLLQRPGGFQIETQIAWPFSHERARIETARGRRKRPTDARLEIDGTRGGEASIGLHNVELLQVDGGRRALNVQLDIGNSIGRTEAYAPVRAIRLRASIERECAFCAQDLAGPLFRNRDLAPLRIYLRCDRLRCESNVAFCIELAAAQQHLQRERHRFGIALECEPLETQRLTVDHDLALSDAALERARAVQVRREALERGVRHELLAWVEGGNRKHELPWQRVLLLEP